MSKTKQKSIDELLEEALVPEDEQPYEVPGNWVWVRLISCKRDEESFGDGDWILSENIDPHGEVRLIQLSDIGQGEFLDNSSKYISIKTFEELGCTEILPGDILISRMAHPIARSCIVPNLKQKLITAVDIAYLRPNERLFEKKYLNYMFNSVFFRRQAEKVARGTMRLRITRKNLGNLAIPFPPLSEQKRIAEKIERLFAKIDEAKRLIEEVKESFELRRAAILEKAFRGELGTNNPSEISILETLVDIKENDLIPKDEQPYKVPKNWVWTRVHSLGEVVTGSTPSKKNNEYYGTKYPFFKPTDLNQGYEVIEAEENLSEVGFLKTRPIPEKSVMVTCIGATIGKTGFSRRKEAATNQQINTIVVNSKLIPEFVYFGVISPFFQNSIKENASSTTMPIINKRRFENLLFPLPPYSEQKRIVEKLEMLLARLDNEKEIISNVEQKLDLLKQSILNKAFHGELGTNDPNDEHAMELLKEVLRSK